MKNPIILLLCTICALTTGAQVGIGTTTPNSTLEVQGSLAAKTTVTTSTNYNLGSEHILIYTGNSAATVTLPDASTIGGRMYTIKNGSTAGTTPPLTVNTTSSQTIDGITSQILSSLHQTITVVSNGTNWNIVSFSLPGGSSTDWSLNGNSVSGEYTLGTKSGSPYALPFITGGTERMRITNSGNVGIGTSTFNATYPERLIVDAGSTGNTNFQNVIVGKGNTNSYAQLNIQNNSAGTAASSDVVATANNGSETVNFIDMGINGGGNTSSGVLGGANTAYLYSTGSDLAIGNGTASKNLNFFTNDGGTLTEQMRITSDGNVGIGSNGFDATAPEKLLIDAGSTASYNLIGAYGSRNGYLQFNIQNLSGGGQASTDIVATADNGTETANYVNLGINSSSYSNGTSNLLNGANNAYLYSKGEDFVIGNASTSKSIIFFTGGDAPGNEKFRLNSTGVVLKSDLFPTSDATYLLGKSGARWSAVWSANGTIQTSDKRLKTNIHTLKYGLKEIMAMRPVSYNWITTPGINNKIGLLAQDVQTLIPEVVIGDASKENLGMNYAELVPVLINAIKEQQYQIEELKKKVTRLERK